MDCEIQLRFFFSAEFISPSDCFYIICIKLPAYIIDMYIHNLCIAKVVISPACIQQVSLVMHFPDFPERSLMSQISMSQEKSFDTDKYRKAIRIYKEHSHSRHTRKMG